MYRVTLATHCHSRDLPRLHAPGELTKLIEGHAYPFSEIIIAHQRCKDLPYTCEIPNAQILNIEEIDYSSILRLFGMNPDDKRLDEITHGWSWQWYWKHHCVNHLYETIYADSDFIVYSDADCRIVNQPVSWVSKGIQILNEKPNVFMVSPSDGGHEFRERLSDGTRLVEMTSQQLFLARTNDMKSLNFTDLQWDGTFIEGGPMQEWYGMLEGWLYRWMKKHNLYRAILPDQWRYWHEAWH